MIHISLLLFFSFETRNLKLICIIILFTISIYYQYLILVQQFPDNYIVNNTQELLAIVCFISGYINHTCCQNVLLFEQVVGLSSFIEKEHALLVYLIIILYKLIYYACSCFLYSITQSSKNNIASFFLFLGFGR